MLLALALYLYDSARLLSGNQAVLVHRRAGWLAAFGSQRWKIRGREPYLPNPLTPHRQLFVLRWRFAGTTQVRATPRVLDTLPALRVFTPWIWLSAACLFVGLPLGLFTRAGLWAVVPALALMYLSNATALLLLWRRRHTLGLQNGPFGTLAFECLSCPPFALNLVRKLCATQPVVEDFEAACLRLLDPTTLTQVKAQCLLRLDEQIACEDEASSEMPALLNARLRFAPAEDAP